MINNDRIVSVTKTDLISLYSLILAVGSVTLTKLNADNANGDFTVEVAPQSGSLIATEPVKSIAIDDAVSAVSIYFVPAYDFEGITGGTIAGAEVEADGNSLYTATLSSGTITIAKVGM